MSGQRSLPGRGCSSIWNSRQGLEIHWCSGNLFLISSHSRPRRACLWTTLRTPPGNSGGEAECHRSSTQHRKSRLASPIPRLCSSEIFPSHPHTSPNRRATTAGRTASLREPTPSLPSPAQSPSTRSTARPPGPGSTGSVVAPRTPLSPRCRRSLSRGRARPGG